ncbi:hypothetical protein [Merdibacter massiliensis]|uniref:hypothetical protein n=1 Tax=Merdibacter massiliensis TaxID=1871030 RepID=UPI00096A9244|nr:hypothetical protein [Merdibacter massiliensis]
MLSYYKQLFDSFKKIYPECYQEIIQRYLFLKLDYHQKNKALSIVEILGHLRNFENDPLNQKVYADLYSVYGNSKFLTKNLTVQQMQYICERYLQGLQELGKEYGCVI